MSSVADDSSLELARREPGRLPAASFDNKDRLLSLYIDSHLSLSKRTETRMTPSTLSASKYSLSVTVPTYDAPEERDHCTLSPFWNLCESGVCVLECPGPATRLSDLRTRLALAAAASRLSDLKTRLALAAATSEAVARTNLASAFLAPDDAIGVGSPRP